jgi:Bifunctional DNA primase/polymerase, N-terminal
VTKIVDEASAEALRHERRGWSVLPLTGKEPNSRLIRHTRGSASWRSFQTRRARPDEIERWFDLEESTNIGVCTGQISGGLVVVDADDEAAAPKVFPATATVRTGRGRHYYLQLAGEAVRSRDFAWGELRADGRYVVAPVSWHESGRRYVWELEPEEAGLAPLSGPLAETLLSRAQESAGTGSAIRSTWELRSTWESGAIDPGLVGRLANALGVSEVRYGRSFRCLIHEDGRPSAALWRACEGAQILYHDFHAGRFGDPAWLPLSRVRAHVAGRRGYLGKPELAVWRLRLAAEVGELEPLRFDAPAVPRGLEPLWNGFLYLLGIRWKVSPDEPAPFTRRFAAAWCGVSEWDARDSLAELCRLGLLAPAGRDPRGTRLWLPRGVVPLD